MREVSAEMMQQAQGSQSRLEQDRGPGGQSLENNLLDYLTGWKNWGEIENMIKTKKIDNKNLGKTKLFKQ